MWRLLERLAQLVMRVLVDTVMSGDSTCTARTGGGGHDSTGF